MEIDPKRLRDLLKIIEEGSFTRAAEVLGVSQPALSNSIALLEHELGVRVLERDRHGAAVTEYGRTLEGYARSLETILSRAAQEIGLKKDGYAGSIVIGVTPIGAATLVPEAIAQITAETPNISITVKEAVDDQLIAELRTGNIDVMVGPVGTDPPLGDIDETPIVEDVFMLVMRPEHRLSHKRGLTLPQLRDEHWVMPEIGTASRRQMQTLFGLAALPWPARCTIANSIVAIKAILRQCDSVSIISRQLVAAERDAGHLKCIPLRGVRYARTVGVRTNRNIPPSPLAERFIRSLKAAGDLPG